MIKFDLNLLLLDPLVAPVRNSNLLRFLISVAVTETQKNFVKPLFHFSEDLKMEIFGKKLKFKKSVQLPD